MIAAINTMIWKMIGVISLIHCSGVYHVVDRELVPFSTAPLIHRAVKHLRWLPGPGACQINT